jgi:hypothetical protein
MLAECSDGLKLGKGTGTAGMLLSSPAALFMSPVEMPLSESRFERNSSVHTQLNSSVFNYKSGGTLWLRRPDVVIIKVCVHIMVLVGVLLASSCEIWVEGCRLTYALCVRHATDVVFFGHNRRGKEKAEVRVDNS